MKGRAVGKTKEFIPILLVDRILENIQGRRIKYSSKF